MLFNVSWIGSAVATFSVPGLARFPDSLHLWEGGVGWLVNAWWRAGTAPRKRDLQGSDLEADCVVIQPLQKSTLLPLKRILFTVNRV